MEKFNVVGNRYDNVLIRRTVRRGSNMFQTYQMYRQGTRVIDTGSVIWEVLESIDGYTIIGCKPDTNEAVILPDDLQNVPIVKVESGVLDRLKNNLILNRKGR